ncbi:MAG: exodeoxyribonuclease VII large subunit, partial [Chloroflexi bacterium]|nr:exodeoxyribonuclease VII large subunit [Chloroflexota bacterium]
MHVQSVSQVTRYIKALIDSDQELTDLWIEGEISDFRRASSGHCYFTLKDEQAELRCVIWRQQARYLGWLPAPGELVDAHGYVSVYERGGVYQFYVDRLLQSGDIGARWREFLQLRDRLQAEGLFDVARKRPLPPWPQRIGVVTSPTGAALQDILHVLAERYPLVEVVLSPSAVQGEGAGAQLAAAVERFRAAPDVDVVIVARGGGSTEDLWPFNDEGLARAIVACRAPVVSGVGHETDFTIADFAADVRAPTPSAAAAAVVPDRRELLGQLRERTRALTERVVGRIAYAREQVERQERLLRIQDPRRVVAERRQGVDDLLRRAHAALRARRAFWRMQVDRYKASLQALNPLLVMQRGYAVVHDRASGAWIRSIAQVATGAGLTVRLHDGRMDAEVARIWPDESY